MPLLQLDDVEVKYSGVILVLRGVSLRVDKREFVALLGSNGAGKSTTLKAVSGMLRSEEGRVTKGTITFDGQHIENGNPQRSARLGIIHVLEGRAVLAQLTVEENLRVAAFVAGDSAQARRDLSMVYECFPVLKEYRLQTSGYLSGGEQQMLVIGRALMAHPKLMLIDEASLGLAPLVVEEIFGILRKINDEEGVPILLVEQNAEVALSHAVRGYVMENGQIVLSDTSDGLRANDKVKAYYMGLNSSYARDGELLTDTQDRSVEASGHHDRTT